MESKFLISIVLPVYNVEQHLERCLLSLQSQTYSCFEMLFVDDCGQDSSIELISKYAKNDKRIRIVRNKRNLGTYHSRKVGVESAVGQYILFLDPDDELEKGFLSFFVENVKLSPIALDIVFYDALFVPERKWYQSKYWLLPFSRSGSALESVFKKNGKVSVSPGTLGKVFKRSFLMDVYSSLNVDINYRYVFTEDRLIYFAALINNPSFVSLRYKGYIYHKNNGSITNKKSFNDPDFLVEQQLYTVEKLKKLIDENVDSFSTSERKLLDFLILKTGVEEVSLMRRFESDGRYYFNHVLDAFKVIPDTKQLIRMFVYLISFKKIKL